LNFEKKLVDPNGPQRLWAPFVFMVASLVLAFAYASLVVYSYVNQYYPGLPDLSGDAGYFFSSMTTLIIPIFLIGISLMLHMRIRIVRGAAETWKLAFYGGTLLIFAGSLLNIIIFNSLLHYQDRIGNFDLLNNVSFFGSLSYAVGTILCIIATIFLMISYLNGELTRAGKRNHLSN